MKTNTQQSQQPADTASYYTEREVQDALAAFGRGDLCLLKGDIGYGLLGNSDAAIRKMYAAKGRPYSNPCIVIGNLAILRDVASFPSPEIERWVAAMAARTTLAVVLPVNPRSRLLTTLPAWVLGQVVTHQTIAAFLNVGPFLEQVIEGARQQQMLVVGSSANPSSQGNIYDFAELPPQIVAAADFKIDHGRSLHANPERKATTIVNFTNWTVKRRGVNAEFIEPSFFQLKEQLAPAAV
ncbi:MAG: Sua5/YciO/YrdC/YwlC family protein [Ramlibacter sp.]|nr:Sua5/YciO/YrdC/YwlC family protein [Ramlibacter sp.]